MTIELNDLPRRLMELRHRLNAGEEVVLTDGGESFARVVPRMVDVPSAPQRLGFAKGGFPWIAPDFDAPLPDDFWLGGDP
jgi:antitoxin (DNA-binding transcriptional repressor) of toxin-antitoxin stability system